MVLAFRLCSPHKFLRREMVSIFFLFFYTSVDMINNKIWAFLQDLKHWMTCNFLKLNESKNKVIEILSDSNVQSRLI